MIDLSAIDREYREIGPAAIETWRHEFDRVNSPLLPFTDAMWTVAGEHSALCLGMMWLENQYSSTGIIIHPGDYNPLSSRPWIGDPTASVWRPVIDWRTRKPIDRTILVPGTSTVAVKQGMIFVPDYCVGAIVDGADGIMLRFESPQAAVWEWRRRIVDDPGYKGGVYTDKHTLTEMLNTYAPPGDVHPETDVDNADINYPSVVKTKLIQYHQFEQGLDEEKDTDMPTYTTTIPGLPAPVTTSFPVHVNLVPLSVSNVRPGLPARLPRRWVQHETGNPRSFASGENRYLLMGAEGRQASYHFAGDDKEVYVNIPLNEVTWQAADGGGPGNYNGVSYELCVPTAILADPKRKERSRQIAAEMFGVVAAQLGIDRPERHWDFNYNNLPEHRHHCPDTMMQEGYWPTFVENALRYKAAALGETQEPTYHTPVPIPALAAYNGKPVEAIPYRVDEQGWVAFAVHGRTVRAEKDTPRRLYATGEERTGPDITKGTEFPVEWIIVSVDFPDTYLTPDPWYTRVRAEDTQPIA